MKKIILSLLLGSALASCDVPEEGFFSPEGIKMREDTVEVIRGLFQLSAIPEIDNSTRPLDFRMVQIRDLRTGEIIPQTEYDVRMWTGTFDPDQDSTMEQVNKKLEIRKVLPVEVNARSGQLAFNMGTVYMKSDLYGVDVHASNRNSEKTFENFCVFKLMSKAFETPTDFGDAFGGIPITGEKGRVNINPAEEVTFPTSAKERVLTNTYPTRKLTKVKDSDIITLTMVVRDAEGKPFKGKDITFWPNSAGEYLPSYHDNSIAPEGSLERVQYTDTSCVFTFPTVPYPKYFRGQTSFYPIYYCINWEVCKFSPYGKSIADAYNAKNPNAGFIQYSARFRSGYKINEPGEWLLEVTSPFVLRNY